MTEFIQANDELFYTLIDLDKELEETEVIMNAMRNLRALNQVARHYHSTEALAFIEEKFSLEANFEKGVQGTTDPQMKQQSAPKANTDKNKDGKVNGATGAGSTNKMANMYGGLKEKLALKWQGMQTVLRKGWIAFQKACNTGMAKLANKMNEIGDDDDLEVSGICTNIQDAQLEPVLAQIRSAKTKEDCDKIVNDWSNKLKSMVSKDTVVMSKQQFQEKVINPFQAALARGRDNSDEKTASNEFESQSTKVAESKNPDEMKMTTDQQHASVRAQSIYMSFIGANLAKILYLKVKPKGTAVEKKGGNKTGQQQTAAATA